MRRDGMQSKSAPAVRAKCLILGAAATGLSIPPVVVAFAIAAEFLPAGSDVPYLSSFVLVQPLYLIVGIVAVLLGIAIIWSIVREFFMAIGLGIVILVSTPVGCVLGVMVFSAAEDHALEKFSDRSMAVVRAIEDHHQAFGIPPTELGGLKEVPVTGLTEYPGFYYAPDAGPCSAHNAWHLSVSVPEFGVRYLIYCPMQDYDAMDLDEQFKVRRFGAW